MKIAAVIPARMDSSRFPGKPLAPILGRPMIEHVYRRTAMSKSLSEVIIATCDKEIREAAENFGAKAVMTADTHERASDRVAEAARGMDADVVVLVQGDEPMTHPDMIDAAVGPFLKGDDVACVNLTRRIESEKDFLNPNTIKVVMDGNSDALFMSRQPIPSCPKGDFSAITAYKQVCIIPFRIDSLFRYSELAPTPLEIAESIDMMRFIEHGLPVRMVETGFDSHAVDTPQERREIEAMMQNDPMTGTY